MPLWERGDAGRGADRVLDLQASILVGTDSYGNSYSAIAAPHPCDAAAAGSAARSAGSSTTASQRHLFLVETGAALTD